jgi:hypothetical protein
MVGVFCEYALYINNIMSIDGMQYKSKQNSFLQFCKIAKQNVSQIDGLHFAFLLR